MYDCELEVKVEKKLMQLSKLNKYSSIDNNERIFKVIEEFNEYLQDSIKLTFDLIPIFDLPEIKNSSMLFPVDKTSELRIYFPVEKHYHGCKLILFFPIDNSLTNYERKGNYKFKRIFPVGHRYINIKEFIEYFTINKEELSYLFDKIDFMIY